MVDNHSSGVYLSMCDWSFVVKCSGSRVRVYNPVGYPQIKNIAIDLEDLGCIPGEEQYPEAKQLEMQAQ